MGFLSRESPEEKFWKWFAANAPRFASAQPDERLIAEIGDWIEKAAPGVVFEMSVEPVNGFREFIISADGIRDRIPAVQNLVGAAPKIPGWKVIAFRQPKPGLRLGMGDRSFGPEDLKFRPLPEGEHIGVEVHLPGYREGDEQAMGIAFLLLDSALGEYVVMTRVGSVTLKPLVAGASDPSLRPLSEVGRLFEAKFGK